MFTPGDVGEKSLVTLTLRLGRARAIGSAGRLAHSVKAAATAVWPQLVAVSMTVSPSAFTISWSAPDSNNV